MDASIIKIPDDYVKKEDPKPILRPKQYKYDHPIFKKGDTVALFSDIDKINFNDSYSNLFNKKTYLLSSNASWNQKHDDWEYDYKFNTSKFLLLQKCLIKIN